MSLYVVDSSVAAKWFFLEPHSEEALTLLDNRHELHAPDLLLMEVDSVVCKRIRTREITVRLGREIRAALRRSPVRFHPSEPLLEPAFELAVDTRQSIYDCVFLALAILLRGQMATADRRFFNSMHASRYADAVCWVADMELEQS
jgi:predicted nucleic acid-binding protein